MIVFLLFLFSYIFPWHKYGIESPFPVKDYKLGLDLQWWIELDYKVDLSEVRKEPWYDNNREKAIVEWLKSIIDKRIESLNINDSIITSADYIWEQHIIVQIPLKGNSSLENTKNIERAKKAIWKVVKIEFKEKRNKITEEDYKQRTFIAQNLLEEFKSSEYPFSVTSEKYNNNYEWTSIWEVDDIKTIFDFWTWSVDKITKEKIIDNIFEVENKTTKDKGYLILSYTKDKEYSYIFINKQPSDWKAAMDSKWRILNDKYFVKSSVQYNEAFQPMIELTFNDDWAEIFWELTKRLTWKQIAIFVWWEMLTAPNVNEPILSWKAVITWRYTPEEAKKLSQDINTWVVPAPIYLTSERTIDSKLWSNSLQKLIIAWVSWFLIILLFLVLVYRVSWFIAWVALLIYVALVLFVIKVLWIVLTLASIAWLILSIGMAIDANILIFERVKDELKKWNPLKKAVKVWFNKSWTAIWDSNVTGLIIAIILFVFWVNMIKWFWLMLAIWIIISLFSVMLISKILIVLFADLWMKKTIFIWKIK